jgi:hypothetical protein
MARHPAIALVGDTRHLRAPEPARALDLDALGTKSHRALHGLLHCALIRDALIDLFGYALGHQLRLKLGLMDFLDI